MPGVPRLLAIAVIATAIALPAQAHAARQWFDASRVATGSEAYEDGDMAVTLPGPVIAAWRGDGATDHVLRARMVGPDGIGAETVLGGGHDPAVAAVGLTDAVVAWTGSADPSVSRGSSLMVAEWTPDGGFGPSRPIAAVDTWTSFKAIAGNVRGEAIVAYEKDDRIWSVRRSDKGVWGVPQAVSPSASSGVGQPQVGLAETGEAVFAWVSSEAPRIRTATQMPGEPVVLGTAYDIPPGGTGDVEMAVNALGAAVLTWPEIAQDDYFAGPLKAAMRAPGGAFGEEVDTGGSTDDTDEAGIGVSADGHAVITWLETRPTGSHSGAGYGVRVATGLVPAGLGPPEQFSYELADGPPRLAVDHLGNALILFQDWDTWQLRVVRRAVSGLYGQERNPIPCKDDPQYYGMEAHVDVLGNATILWKDVDFFKDRWPMYVSRDQASVKFGPDPCPPHPPAYKWTPKDPDPLEEVVFDGSGVHDPDGGETTYSWDWNADGNYEVQESTNPVARHRFLQSGEHQVRFKYYQRGLRPGTGAGGTYHLKVRVGMEPEPAYEGQEPYGYDPPPPDLPDENPWPYIPKVELPIELPIELPQIELPSVPVVEPPTGDLPLVPANVRPAGGGAVTLEAPAAVRPATLLRKGLTVGLLSERGGRVRLRLRTASLKRARKAPSSVVAETVVRLPAGSRKDARIKLGRAGAKLIKRLRAKALLLEAKPLGANAPVAKQLIRLAR